MPDLSQSIALTSINEKSPVRLIDTFRKGTLSPLQNVIEWLHRIIEKEWDSEGLIPLSTTGKTKVRNL